jgi:glycosyltransferase involved in cell wall biosynthesis
MFRRVFSRIQKWPGLFLFHYRRFVFRVGHGKIMVFNPLCCLESFYWMQLAKYEQYGAKEVVYDKLPAPSFTGELPSISVVTPSYNHARFLEETIRSVLDQEYPKLTYAVVDGGSADGSAEIIERYKDRLSFWVSEPDKGQSDAIVKGMAKLDGEIQAYLNSDDFLAPGTLRYVGAYFAEHPEVDVVYGHRIIVDGNTREIGRWILPPHYDESTKHFDYIPQETMFWRRGLAQKAGGIDPAFHFAMDWDFILRLQASGARFRRLPYFLACFRAHEAQKSQAGSERGKQEIETLMRQTGGDLQLGREYEAAHWKFRKRAFLTSVLLSFGVRC